MALPQSALSELLEAFRAGDGVDLVRDSVRVALQELIDLEATERIGAARYERTEDRVAERNGHRPRQLTTKAGDVELRIAAPHDHGPLGQLVPGDKADVEPTSRGRVTLVEDGSVRDLGGLRAR